MSPADPPDHRPDRLPDWLAELAENLNDVPAEDPVPDGRAAAVLLLIGNGPDLLLIERARDLRAHAGQAALPGGAVDPQDSGPVAAALREAAEEVGVDPERVRILGSLPPRRISVSGYAVTPVLGYWHDPNPIRVVDPAEVASVHRVPLAQFLDPDRRYQARHPSGGVGPAFAVDGLLVWGFTAWLIDRVLVLGGWAEPLTDRTSAGILSVSP